MDSDGRPGQMRQKRPTVVVDEDDTPFKDDEDDMQEDSLAARLFSGRATTNLADLQ